MSKYKYPVTQIGRWKLDEPVFMTISTRRKSKGHCGECGGEIEVGETYYYRADEAVCYCVVCIGVDGDPEDLLSMEIPEHKYDDS